MGTTELLISRSVQEPENIGTSREEVEKILENFKNSATVSQTTLQRCIVVYQIYKYTVQFLLPIGTTDSKNRIA